MINQTQEQERESLEGLARQVVGNREKIKASIKDKFEQEWPARWEKEKKAGLYQYSDLAEEEEREIDLDTSLTIGLLHYDNFKKYVKNIANPLVFTRLTEKDRRNLLKLILIHRERPLSERYLFAQQKLRYYLDLRKNRPLQNVAQLSPFDFGKTGFLLPTYGHFSSDCRSLSYLGKRSYEKLCDRIRAEVPRIYNYTRKAITQLVQNDDEHFLTFFRVGAKELIRSDKGNVGSFSALIAYADSFVNRRKMTEQEWSSLNSIKEEGIKINKWNQKRYHPHSMSD